MPSESENQFLDEVLGLFALEAQEWVTQVNTALTELEQPCAPERAAKLYDIILRGISNLGGSAATVELGRIEKLAFGLLPVLQTMQRESGTLSPATLRAVRLALDRMVVTVQGLSHTKSDTMPDLEELLNCLAGTTTVTSTALQPESAAESVDSVMDSPVASRMERIRTALVEIQQAQARTPEQTRNLAEIVLRKAQGESDDELDEPAISRAVRELEMLDEQFLEEVRRRAPGISLGFAHFKDGHIQAPQPITPGRQRVFQDIEHLYEISRLVNSTPIMFYLRGLRQFLKLATDHPHLIPNARYASVETRLAMLQALAERWVEVGRQERAAIENVLQT